MAEKYNNLEVTPELENLIQSQSEKYADILKEWQTPNNNGETKAIVEARKMCNLLSLTDGYKKYYLEEWAEDVFFFEAFLHFDDTKSKFDTFFSRVTRNKILYAKDYYDAKGRKSLLIEKDSLDRPASEDGDDNRTLGEVYCDYNAVNFEDDRVNSLSEDEKNILNSFLDNLSDNAKLLVKCKFIEEMKKEEILQYTKMSEKEYKAAWQEFKRKSASYDMMSLNQNRVKDNIETTENKTTEEIKEEPTRMTTKEKNKIIATNVKDYLEDVGRKEIRPDLALQRVQGIWTPEMVGNLITTVLSGYPFPNIICAEDGRSGDVYIIDGGQRTDALYRFKNNLIPINKKSEHLEITYDEPEYDENGNIKENEKGFGIFHSATVNVGGMYYRDLPAELQRKFCKGQVMVEKYLACTTEEMAWHMRRYNNMKPMTASQKGLTYLGMDMGKSIITITKNHNFFKNFNKYTKLTSKAYQNGDFNRIVNESLMAIFFLNDWQKKQTDLNTYLRINASKEMVSEISNLLDKLIEAGIEDVREMFTSKNSFIWITLFSKFTELGESDERFVEFMKEFRDSLHETEFNGVIYDVLDKKASKDKTTVIAKINHLEGLMREYLGFDANASDDEDDTDVDNGANKEIEISTEVSNVIVEDEFVDENPPLDESIEPDVSIVVSEQEEKLLEQIEQETVEAEAGPVEEVSNEDVNDEEVSEMDTDVETDTNNGISPNAEVLRDYVEEFYDNEYGVNVKDMISEADAKRMAIETMLMYSADSDLSMEHMAEYCSESFTNSHFEKMKDIVRASKEVNYFAESVADTAIFEDYENYPLLTLLMIYMGTNRQGVTYTDEEIIEWLNDLTPRFDDMSDKAKSKTDVFRAMIADLKEYKAKKSTTMVEKKKVNLDF